MKSIIATSIAAVAALVVGCTAHVATASSALTATDSEASADHLEAGAKAPDFKLASTDGKTYDLKSLTAKGPAFLYFIKDKCSANPRSLPLFNKVAGAYKGKVTLLGVVNGNKKIGEDNIAWHDLQYELLLDEKMDLIQAYGLEKANHLYLIGQDGKIQKAFHGFGKDALMAMSASMAEVAKVPVATLDLSGAPNRVAYG